MSFSLSQLETTVAGLVGLLSPAASLVSAIAGVVPTGTAASTVLSSAQAGLTSAVTAAGGIEADVEAIWPHIESIFTAAEGIYDSFIGKTAAPAPAPVVAPPPAVTAA